MVDRVSFGHRTCYFDQPNTAFSFLGKT